jgi:hypothetical protein
VLAKILDAGLHSIWMAGGGVKPGMSHGKTDDLGYNAVEDVVHVHDLHATIIRNLNLLFP